MGQLQQKNKQRKRVGCPQGWCGLPGGSEACQGEEEEPETALTEGLKCLGVAGVDTGPEEKKLGPVLGI